MTTTIYRPVPGYEDLYVGMDTSIVKAGHGVLEQKQRGPYMTVRLPDLGIRNVHNLMAAAYLGEKPAGMHVRHGKKGRLVNGVGNLCYGTNGDNQRDSVADGTHRNTVKDKCPQGHEYTPENTYYWPGAEGRRRQCRKCRYISNQLDEPKVRGRHISPAEQSKLVDLLQNSPELPNRQIAKLINVSPQTVARWRARQRKSGDK